MANDFNPAKHSLDIGNRYPYDAKDSWWRQTNSQNLPIPKAFDWAHKAARGVLADLNDRRDIKRGFADLDEDVRIDIVEALAAIIRMAYNENENNYY